MDIDIYHLDRKTKSRIKEMLKKALEHTKETCKEKDSALNVLQTFVDGLKQEVDADFS